MVSSPSPMTPESMSMTRGPASGSLDSTPPPAMLITDRLAWRAPMKMSLMSGMKGDRPPVVTMSGSKMRTACFTISTGSSVE